jgi:D-glycero-D-manno-heptose 1,7-bisphosphate phosphatase
MSRVNAGMVNPQLFDRYDLVIFDADETLRRTTDPGKPCPHTPEEWVLMPGVRDTLRAVAWGQHGGPALGVASNQDQVAYGYLSLVMARRLLKDLVLEATGITPAEAALQLCPHPAELECRCRKPQPGMLLAIMSHYSTQPAATLFVGNHEVDREAAARAGTDFIWAANVFGWHS